MEAISLSYQSCIGSGGEKNHPDSTINNLLEQTILEQMLTGSVSIENDSRMSTIPPEFISDLAYDQKPKSPSTLSPIDECKRLTISCPYLTRTNLGSSGEKKNHQDLTINNLLEQMQTEKNDSCMSIITPEDTPDLTTLSSEDIEGHVHGAWTEDFIEEIRDESDVHKMAREAVKCEGIVNILEDYLHTISRVSECETNYHALEHFDKAKDVWGDPLFIGFLLKTRNCLPSVKTYEHESKLRLSVFLVAKIRSDRAFPYIFRYRDYATLMRNALSILIGYWSNEYMISRMLSMGDHSLRSCLAVMKVDDALVLGEEIKRNKMLRGPSTPVRFIPNSPIGKLRKDSSIKELADRLLKFPKVIMLAKEYLDTIMCNDQKAFGYHDRHARAAGNFWRNSTVNVELIKALSQSTSLVKVFRKYSKFAQLLRCVDRVSRIRRDPLLESIFSDDPVVRMRGALSVLFGYWADGDLRELFRRFCISGYGLRQDDKIRTFEYLRDDVGDLKGLKNVLTEKYSEDSDEFLNLFDTISKAQRMKEQSKMRNFQPKMLDNMSKKNREAMVITADQEQTDTEAGSGRERAPALINVLLRNEKVIMIEVIQLQYLS